MKKIRANQTNDLEKGVGSSESVKKQMSFLTDGEFLIMSFGNRVLYLEDGMLVYESISNYVKKKALLDYRESRKNIN